MLLEQVDEPAQEEGQQGGRDGAQQDQGVVAGLHALVDEGAQAAQADHGGQHGPAHGVDHGHAQPADDGGHGQGQLHQPQPLKLVHAAAPGGLFILGLHRRQARHRVFQHREGGVDTECGQHGDRPHPKPQKQQADKDDAGHGVQHGQGWQDKTGRPGEPGQDDAQGHPQHEAHRHRDHRVAQVDGHSPENIVDGLHGHIHHPHRCSAMAAAIEVLVMIPATVLSGARTTR